MINTVSLKACGSARPSQLIVSVHVLFVLCGVCENCALKLLREDSIRPLGGAAWVFGFASSSGLISGKCFRSAAWAFAFAFNVGLISG